jgi:hypothetical protein
MSLGFITVIPNGVDSPRLPVEFGSVLIVQSELNGYLLHD